MKKERVVWVDYTKALAIFFVVLGHSGIQGSYLECWIYGLHMPLFMLLSGYFSDKSKGLFNSIKSDFFSLVIPYYFFSLLLIPFMWFVEALGGVHGFIPKHTDIITQSQKLLLDDAYHCGPIWFLGALFINKRVYQCFAIMIYSNKTNSDFFKELLYAIIILIIILVLVYLSVFCDIPLLSADSAMALFPYYIGGVLLKQVIQKASNKTKLLTGMITLLIYSIIMQHAGYVCYDRMELGNNKTVSYLAGMFGCYSIMVLMSLLEHIKMPYLMNIGQHTLAILGLHLMFIQLFRFPAKVVFGEPIPLVYLITMSLLVVIISYRCSLIVIKKYPVLLGRRNK